MPEFDVVGVGLNATDTLLLIPHFPAYGGKVPFVEEILSPGGQVASEIGTTQYPGTENAVYGAVATDAGAVPGSVGQASYSDPVAGLPSQYPAASTPEVRTATTAGQPWRPGSTTNYQ